MTRSHSITQMIFHAHINLLNPHTEMQENPSLLYGPASNILYNHDHVMNRKRSGHEL